mmetsp:Transcript_831/g.1854  ORF Transcript_831/g.1854 Transcript_831/m.1854 type:complete len:215 (-) Transcript_831:1980-2624(-)
MSVYSGFVTRQQESVYFSLTEQLVYTLQLKLLDALQGSALNAAQLATELLPVYGQLARMETNKYLPPKISHCCLQLADFLSASYDAHSANISYASVDGYAEPDWTSMQSTPRTSRASKGSVSFSSTTRKRKPKLSSSRLVQGRSGRGILYETTIIEERPQRIGQRNYYAQLFTKKLASQSPTDRSKMISKRTLSVSPSPFKSGRHLMMPITALI